MEWPTDGHSMKAQPAARGPRHVYGQFQETGDERLRHEAWQHLPRSRVGSSAAALDEKGNGLDQ